MSDIPRATVQASLSILCRPAMPRPTASVILSTYNQPDWLEKTLRGFAAQNRHDFEVVIADDGSREDTRERIEQLRAGMPFDLIHVWQPDEGFRKCRALNRAITASRGEYLIFTDGDCIPRSDFVSAHLRLREPGKYLSGGYLKLPMALSQAISAGDIADNRCFDLGWLRACGLPSAARNIRLLARGSLSRLLDALIQTCPTWNGHNASGWRQDLLRINGFDERMGYGGEDCELGERLVNAGLRGKRVRHRAVVLHLDHARSYRTDESLRHNAEIRRHTREQKITRTSFGIEPSPPPIFATDQEPRRLPLIWPSSSVG